MRDCAKHFLIVSPIAPISSRPAPTPIASDALSSGKRKNSTDEPVQMKESGKPGKQESCFPPFPLSLEIPKSGIPIFTQLRLFLSRSNQTLKPRGQHSLEKRRRFNFTFARRISVRLSLGFSFTSRH